MENITLNDLLNAPKNTIFSVALFSNAQLFLCKQFTLLNSNTLQCKGNLMGGGCYGMALVLHIPITAICMCKRYPTNLYNGNNHHYHIRYIMALKNLGINTDFCWYIQTFKGLPIAYKGLPYFKNGIYFNNGNPNFKGL